VKEISACREPLTIVIRDFIHFSSFSGIDKQTSKQEVATLTHAYEKQTTAG